MPRVSTCYDEATTTRRRTRVQHCDVTRNATCFHANVATQMTQMLPRKCCHANVATQMLPRKCCHANVANVATQLLPRNCCHAIVATQLLPTWLRRRDDDRAAPQSLQLQPLQSLHPAFQPLQFCGHCSPSQALQACRHCSPCNHCSPRSHCNSCSTCSPCSPPALQPCSPLQPARSQPLPSAPRSRAASLWLYRFRPPRAVSTGRVGPVALPVLLALWALCRSCSSGSTGSVRPCAVFGRVVLWRRHRSV